MFPAARSVFRSCWGAAALLAILLGSLGAVDPTQRQLLDLTQPEAELKLVPSAEDQVTVARADTGTGIDIVCRPGGNAYPGISITPEKGTWDLSTVGHVALTATNTGDQRIGVALRIDNAGDWKKNPWNSENLYLKPGQTGTVVVYFGYSYGKKAYALDPAKVSKALVFVSNPKQDQSFRIDGITIGGEPGEAPPIPADKVRIAPVGGVILGAGTALEAKQVEGKGLTASLAAEDGRQSVHIAAEAGTAGRSSLRPAVGRWDLREHLAVRVRVRNDGAEPVQAKGLLESNGGPSDQIPLEVAPGSSAELVIPFASARISDTTKHSGTRFTSDAASAVTIIVAAGDAPRSLVIEEVVAYLPPSDIPEWLGTRPPVEGEWTMTFSDEFDGSAIDLGKWNIYTANYWDKRSHFSAENVIVSDGTVKLRYAKKTGFHNDDPNGKQTDYASGFLDTYGKWTQRYGYFEARFKPPRAPGLWPAFWTMPDRGVELGEQWKRASTHDGGMELDIWEHLTRWGPWRYNIAHHWNGYQKGHKVNGTSNVYIGPDQDGFVTSGVLWEPGRTTYYANGKVVLCWEDPRVCSVQSYPIFTLVSGGWDNSPLDDQTLPADFEIDWIRIWQREDLIEAP